MPKTQAKQIPPKPTFAQGAQPHLVIDNTLHDQEQQMANDIVRSQNPIIIVTKKSSKSMANMGKYMHDTFPNIPIVFEDETAEKEFFKNVGSNAAYITPQCAGHFKKSAEDYSRKIGIEVCSELQQSDCIIVFGSPDNDLRKELSHHEQKIFINETNQPATTPRINMAIIGRMKKPTDQWKSWKNKMRSSPSIC